MKIHLKINKKSPKAFALELLLFKRLLIQLVRLHLYHEDVHIHP